MQQLNKLEIFLEKFLDERRIIINAHIRHLFNHNYYTGEGKEMKMTFMPNTQKVCNLLIHKGSRPRIEIEIAHIYNLLQGEDFIKKNKTISFSAQEIENSYHALIEQLMATNILEVTSRVKAMLLEEILEEKLIHKPKTNSIKI